MSKKEFLNKQSKVLEKEIIEHFKEAQKKFGKKLSKKDIKDILVERKKKELKKRANWFGEHESKVMSRISNPIDWKKFNPVLKIVNNKEEDNVWEYLRAIVWSNPSFGYIGRRFKFYLEDENSKNIIAIAAVGSDLPIIGARDRDIGWSHENKFKDKKLDCGVNLYVCGSLYPYSKVLTGKLMAMVSMANEIKEEWKNKYGDVCLYNVTTSLYGKSSQYNRIKDYLKLVGYTAGFGNIHVSNKVYKKIKTYLNIQQKMPGVMGKGSHKHIVLNALDSVIPELKDCGKHNIKRGIYLGYYAKNSKEYLQNKISKEELEFYDRPSSQIIDFWKQRWFDMRYPKKKDELELKPEMYKIENVLGEKISKQQTLF